MPAFTGASKNSSSIRTPFGLRAFGRFAFSTSSGTITVRAQYDTFDKWNGNHSGKSVISTGIMGTARHDTTPNSASKIRVNTFDFSAPPTSPAGCRAAGQFHSSALHRGVHRGIHKQVRGLLAGADRAFYRGGQPVGDPVAGKHEIGPARTRSRPEVFLARHGREGRALFRDDLPGRHTLNRQASCLRNFLPDGLCKRLARGIEETIGAA